MERSTTSNLKWNLTKKTLEVQREINELLISNVLL